MQRRVVDFDASLLHHFLDLAVAQRIRHIPAHAPQDDIALEVATLELDRHHPPDLNQARIVYQIVGIRNLRQNLRRSSTTRASNSARNRPDGSGSADMPQASPISSPSASSKTTACPGFCPGYRHRTNRSPKIRPERHIICARSTECKTGSIERKRHSRTGSQIDRIAPPSTRMRLPVT